jgi:hypothetical protein
MQNSDSPNVVKTRIIVLAREVEPRRKIDFDPSRSHIRFCFVDDIQPTRSTPCSKALLSSEWADMSDFTLRGLIRQLANETFSDVTTR